MAPEGLVIKTMPVESSPPESCVARPLIYLIRCKLKRLDSYLTLKRNFGYGSVLYEHVFCQTLTKFRSQMLFGFFFRQGTLSLETIGTFDRGWTNECSGRLYLWCLH